MNQYHVYIMTNWNSKVLYTGVTNNLLRRINEHKLKTMKGFTEKYKITKLVYYEAFNYIKDAISAEKKIKGWTRQKKNNLVASLNPNWTDLSPKLEEYSFNAGISKDPSFHSG